MHAHLRPAFRSIERSLPAAGLACFLACGGGGGGGGTPGTGAPPPVVETSAFDGTFQGILDVERNGQTVQHAFTLTLDVSPIPHGRLVSGVGEVIDLTVPHQLSGPLAVAGTLLGACAGSLTATLDDQIADQVSVTAGGSDCFGAFTYSGTLHRSFESVAVDGLWTYTETRTIQQTIGGQAQTVIETEVGTVSLSQAGADVSFSTPIAGLARTGTIDASGNLSLSGELTTVTADAGSTISITENAFDAVGPLEGETLLLTGTGSTSGTIDGTAFSYAGIVAITLTRVPAPQSVVFHASSFVPGDNLFPPLLPGILPDCGTFNGGVFQAGHDRIALDGSALFERASERYAARQEVLVSCLADGTLEVTSLVSDITAVEEYAYDALADGAIEADDVDAVLDDCHLLNRTAVALGALTLDAALHGDDTAVVTLRGVVADPYVPGAAPSDWLAILVIDFTSSRPTFTFETLHDLFPAYQVYLGDIPLALHDPGPPFSQVIVTDLIGNPLTPAVTTYDTSLVALGLVFTAPATITAGLAPMVQ